MRYQLIAATALTTTLTSLVPAAVSAQDMFDWSGFYFGGTLGVVQNNNSPDVSYPDGEAGPDFYFDDNQLFLDGTAVSGELPTLFDLDYTSSSVSLNTGYNFQSGQFVYGVEGDVALLGEAESSATLSDSTGNTDVTVTSSLDSLASVRGRVGIAADRVLYFATAGIAAGSTSLSTSLDYSDTGKSSADGSSSGIAVGVIAGLGAEYAVNDNISLKAEGLYYALQGTSATASGSGTNGASEDVDFSPYSVSNSHSGAIVRTGINIRF